MMTTIIEGRTYLLVETLRSRWQRFVRTHIIAADPWDGECHAKSRGH